MARHKLYAYRKMIEAMNHNRIVFAGFEFWDDAIIEGRCFFENSMLCEALSADTMNFTVLNQGWISEPILDCNGETLTDANGEVITSAAYSGGIDMGLFFRGMPLAYYHDNAFMGEFYIKSVKRLSDAVYEIDCLSRIGMLLSQRHYGGMYRHDTFGEIAAHILDGIPYSIDDAVATMPCPGYLPIASKRDNLQQLCFAAGCSVLKDSDGQLRICYNQPVSGKILADDRLSMDGFADYREPATKVFVTEHSYLQALNTSPISLFDNSGGIEANHVIVEFERPCYDLEVSGSLSIEESGANYAVVSGTGTLIGRRYSHITRVIGQATGIDGEDNEIRIANATMVTPINSGNILARVAEYYTNAIKISYNLVVKNERPGDLVLFKDPFFSDTQGYIKSMDVTMSATLAAKAVIVTNWKPSHLGNNYTKYGILTGNNSEIIDFASTPVNGEILYGKSVTFVIFGGGCGGEKGEDGGQGGFSRWAECHTYWKEVNQWVPGPTHATGGKGGKAGKGGNTGRCLSVPIITLGRYYKITFGRGGTGESDEVPAQGGAPTSFQEVDASGNPIGQLYTTDGAPELSGAYINLIDGMAFAIPGSDGLDGADGGDAGWDGSYITAGGVLSPAYDYDIGQNGGNLSDKTGGIGAEFNTDVTPGSGDYWNDIKDYGSAGGGASADSNGQDAVKGSNTYITLSPEHASKPGAGAPGVKPAKAIFAGGGEGGNGGGGSGARGLSIRWRHNPDGSKIIGQVNADIAPGGKGAYGGDGGDGFVLVYY